jgi:ATP-binding protein involved in chromosome partitioning
LRIAIPVAGGLLCAHFGHCETFVLVDVDPEKREVLGTRTLPPPPHEPGVLPRWLKEQGADLVIAGGMGMRAQGLFAESGIRVLTGAPAETPEALARAHLDGTLVTGANTCDH